MSQKEWVFHGSTGGAQEPLATRRQEARMALARILSSKTFSRSERLRDFIRFIVRQAIEEPAGAIKEYAIAVEVYGKRQSFDPRSDPIVRVEGRRLRRKLAQYYRGEGQRDPFELRMPTGRYIPELCRRAETSDRTCVRNPRAPLQVAVEPLVALTDGMEDFSRGLTEEVLHALRAQGLSVAALESDGAVRNENPTAHHQFDNVLRGTVRKCGADLRISARLTRTADKTVIWSEMCQREDYDGEIHMQEEIAYIIARGVKGRMNHDGGPMPQAEAQRPIATLTAAFRDPNGCMWPNSID